MGSPLAHHFQTPLTVLPAGLGWLVMAELGTDCGLGSWLVGRHIGGPHNWSEHKSTDV